MNGTRYLVRAVTNLSEDFEVMTGLKQGDALSPLLLNIALENVIRSVQRNSCRVKINNVVQDVLGFADDLNIFREDKETVIQNTKTLMNEVKKKKKKNRTRDKCRENHSYGNNLSSEDKNLSIENNVFEKTHSFK